MNEYIELDTNELKRHLGYMIIHYPQCFDRFGILLNVMVKEISEAFYTVNNRRNRHG